MSVPRRRSVPRLAALAAVLVLAPVDVRADEGRGEALFEPCRACHSLDPAATGMAGPHLARLRGRIVAATDYDYSPALAAARAAGLVWDRARLEAFLADPPAMFPGLWMSTQDIRDAAERAALAAYLMERE